MKWYLSVFFAVLALCGAAPAQDADALTKSIVGDWTKDGRETVTLNADGSMSNSKGAKGVWKWVNREERKLDVNEGKELISYTVTLAEDGRSAAGKVHRNGADERRVGMGVKLARVGPAEPVPEVDALTKSILTDWKKTGGEVITLHADGTMRGTGGAKGFWKWVKREERTFEVSHGRGRAEYLLTLAEDANTAVGKIHRGNDIGKVIEFVRATPLAPPPKVAAIPTLGGPPLTKPAAEEPSAMPPAASTTAESKPQSVTGKWLAEQDVQWQAAFEREVSGEFDRGLAELKKQYLAWIEAALTAAAREGKLDAAVEIRNERDRVGGGGDVLPKVEVGGMPAIQPLRAAFSQRWKTLSGERAMKARAMHARYDAILSQNQVALTQRQRIDEALEVKAKREQVGAAWLKPLPESPGIP